MAESAWHSIKSFAVDLARRIKSFLSPVENHPQETPPAPFDPAQVANPLFSATESIPGATYEDGPWTLQIYFRYRGSRSQGQHGVLLKDGVEVKGKLEGEILQTGLGELIYRKDPEQISFLWDGSGWDFSDVKQNMPGNVEKV